MPEDYRKSAYGRARAQSARSPPPPELAEGPFSGERVAVSGPELSRRRRPLLVLARGRSSALHGRRRNDRPKVWPLAQPSAPRLRPSGSARAASALVAVAAAAVASVDCKTRAGRARRGNGDQRRRRRRSLARPQRGGARPKTRRAAAAAAF